MNDWAKFVTSDSDPKVVALKRRIRASLRRA